MQFLYGLSLCTVKYDDIENNNYTLDMNAILFFGMSSFEFKLN